MRSKRPDAERFWEKVDAEGDCWEWTAYLNQCGYGTFSVGGRAGTKVLAHRFAWTLLVGPVPEGMELDHLCRVPRCCNPDHLQVVTHAVNLARGYGLAHQRRNRTRCPQGHPYDEANTIISKDKRRCCRACHNESSRRRKQRLRQQQKKEVA